MSGSSSFEVFSRFLELLKVKEVADTDDEEANIALVADLVLSFFSARPNEQQGVLHVCQDQGAGKADQWTRADDF